MPDFICEKKNKASDAMKRFLSRVIRFARRKLGLIYQYFKVSKDKSALFEQNYNHHLLFELSPNFKKLLPGLVYGEFRNLGNWIIPVNKKVKKIRLQLIVNHPEVLHFNHIKIWEFCENSNDVVTVTNGYQCVMSSVSKDLPDPCAAMKGSASNTVSVHSKREKNPWWEIEFETAKNIKCVELFNRKDIWGDRARSLVLLGYDADSKIVTKWGRVYKLQANELFSSELAIPASRIIKKIRKQKGRRIAKNFANSIFDYISFEGSDSEALSKIRDKLANSIAQSYNYLSHNTPDIGRNFNESMRIDLNQREISEVRVIAFGKSRPRIPRVNISFSDEGSDKVCLYATSNYNKSELFEIRKSAWSLPKEFVFTHKFDNPFKAAEFKIWADDQFSADLFVKRQVQVRLQDEEWVTIDSTLDEIVLQQDLLRLHELLIGNNYDDVFIANVADFFATYRFSLARTFKPLIRKNKELKALYYRTINESGRSAKFLPNVIYTRHGLTVPFSELDSNFLAERMFAFCQLMEREFDLLAFPCYGTLLGMYRDKDFLPHDDDIDVAVIVDLPEGATPREATMQWVKKLEEYGLKSKPPTPSSLNTVCYFEGCDIDLFFMYRHPDNPKKIITHMEWYKVRNASRSLFEPLSTLRFKGYEFNVPNKVEGFLADRYGSDWNIPNPQFEI